MLSSAPKLTGIACLIGFFLLCSAYLRADDNAFLSQNEAKSVLLYNFIKHTQWQRKDKPVVEVGFLGASPALVKEFKRISSEASIRGRSISPQILSVYEQAKRLEVLVIGAKYNQQLTDIAAALSQTQTLIISDGASDRSSAMINFIYPKSDKISFEVNKSNIIFEGLTVSNDVLLYGGSEIEVADLYNEMEEALVTVKKRLRQQEAVLFEQQKTISKQAEQIRDHFGIMEQKNQLIFDQTKALSDITLELQVADNTLNYSQFQLSESEKKIAQAKQQLAMSRLESLKLEQNITANIKILADQELEISAQANRLSSQSTELKQQQGTIEWQRNVIFIAFIILLIVAIFIIARQKKSLAIKRHLLEEEARLVRAQSDSIDAFELSLKVKNDFITAINHELSTPMHIIKSALHNLQQTTDTQNDLSYLHDGVEHMSCLIGDMLMFTELQADEAAPHNICTAINKDILQLVSRFQKVIASKPIHLCCDIADNVPNFMMLDSLKFNSAITHILSNACKFTQKGEINVSVRLSSNDATQLLVQVRDSGIGIDSQLLDKIYEPFMQRESGLSRSYQGLGIGLSICKRVMSVLGGDMSIKSVVGQGTEVFMAFPVQIPSAEQVPQALTNSSVAKSSARAKTILLVEDNDVSRLVMQKLLSGLGFSVLCARHGLDAIKLVEREPLDAVLMDVQMPEMDGIECTKLIRLSHNIQPPIVALTANLSERIRQDCLSAGMNAVLSKPVSAEVIESTLNACINNALIRKQS